jgi:hypothetical protein
MGIVFFCQSCGARFEVDPRMAGRRGHCKKCGQITTIPRAEEIASMASMPALAVAGAGAAGAAPAGANAPAAGASMGSWLKAGISKVGLAPLSVDRMPVYRRPSALDDAEDSKPYALAKPLQTARGRPGSNINPALVLWRRQLGGIQKLFRKINQAAYLISVPFVIILIFGIVVKSRHTAVLGATAVILLNIGRIAAGLANLAVVPFRDGLNFEKMKKPLIRVIEPIGWITAVFLAFALVPWLRSTESAKGTIAEQLRSGADDLRRDVKGELNRVVDADKLEAQAQEKFRQLQDQAKQIDVSKLGAQAQEKLGELRDKAKEIDVSKLGAQAQEKLKRLSGSAGSATAKTAQPGAENP